MSRSNGGPITSENNDKEEAQVTDLYQIAIPDDTPYHKMINIV